MSAKPAAGGGRWVEVAPGRLERWLTGFAQRHGEPAVDISPEAVVLRAPDGAVATVEVPFEPLQVALDAAYGGLLAHVTRPRVVGLLLVRRGGYAAGVVEGGRLTASKVGSRHVQGRSAAGGWSQQRFARRREGQAREAAGAAADTVARLLLPEAARLDALVTGGDRAMVDAVLDQARLAPLKARAAARFLPVPDPRRTVLEAAVPQALSVRIRVEEVGDEQPRLIT
jgi:hypothetical protein